MSSESRTITLKGAPVSYRLTRSSRRRTIGFQVGPEGLSVRAPEKLRLSRIENALQGRENWIAEKLLKWENQPKKAALRFETGDKLPFLGGELSLEVRDLAAGVRTKITLEGEVLRVEIDPELAGDLRKATVKRALKRWYVRQAKAIYAPFLMKYTSILGKNAPKLIVRQQESRWGSCDPGGVIRMNWRLIGAEEALIDYVCAHEAAHLVEANHSPAFWAVVEDLMPDHKARRRRLRETQSLIAPF